MLLYFKTSNNLSFDKEIYFTTVAGKYKNSETGKEDLPHNLMPVEKYKVNLLRSSVIYGANASGKSNLLKAITHGIIFLRNSYANSTRPEMWVFEKQYNRFNSENKKKAISYTYGILQNGIEYEYNFSINNERVVFESLLEFRTQKPIEHYIRKYNKKKKNYDWKFSKYFTGEKETVKNITNEKSLFLTVGDISKLVVCTEVMDWFINKPVWALNIDHPNSFYNNKWVLEKIKKEPAFKKMILQYLKIADFTIIDIIVEDPVPHLYLPPVRVIHKAIDRDGKETIAEMDYYTNESEGTKMFIGWIGIWFEVLSNNRIAFFDELGTSIHTLLSKFLIEEFTLESSKLVKATSQLIFTTHDTNLMTRELFRPDQIWLTEKDGLGNSTLQALSEFKLNRSKDLEKTYLQGLYGGIPHLKNQ